MPASSDVQICSNALLLLGSAAIANFSEDSTGATLSSNLWPTVRDAVLRSHPWNCATKRVALAPDVNAPAFDWSYQFQLPGDWLKTLSIGKAEDVQEDYLIENGFVLMDSAICYLRYVMQLTDVTKYDAALTQALTSGMAAVLAYPITKSQAQQDAMQKLHEFHLKLARAADGQEGTPETVGDSPLISVRGR